MPNPTITLVNTTGNASAGPNAEDGSASTTAILTTGNGSAYALSDWLILDLLQAKTAIAGEYRNCYTTISGNNLIVFGTNDSALTPGAAGTQVVFVASIYSYSNNLTIMPGTQTTPAPFRYYLVVPSGGGLGSVYHIGEIIIRTASTSGPVQNLTVAVGNGQNTLNWQAPAAAPAGTFYRVSVATRPVANGSAINDAPTLLADNVAAATYTHNGVVNGQAYYYYVSAVNPNG